MNKVGGLITVEGCEGSGKTSIIREINRFLNDKDIDTYLTREPGAFDHEGLGVFRNRIRNLLLNDDIREDLCERAEIFLFLADRAQHWQQLKPVLEDERRITVLSDRLDDSTLVYQGYGRGYPISSLRMLNNFALASLKPDLTFILDVDVREGLRRKRAQEEVNRMDLQNISFHERVRAGFQMLCKEEPQRCKLIDASVNVSSVFAQIAPYLNAYIMEMYR